jgi:hypothetical protein
MEEGFRGMARLRAWLEGLPNFPHVTPSQDSVREAHVGACLHALTQLQTACAEAKARIMEGKGPFAAVIAWAACRTAEYKMALSTRSPPAVLVAAHFAHFLHIYSAGAWWVDVSPVLNLVRGLMLLTIYSRTGARQSPWCYDTLCHLYINRTCPHRYRKSWLVLHTHRRK